MSGTQIQSGAMPPNLNPETSFNQPYQGDYAIELDGLVCNYQRKVAVDGLSLKVPLGSVYGFIGPNGAGKTTAIKTILGMRKAQGGTIRVLGYDITTQGLESRQRLSYMSEVNNLYGYMQVREMVETARRLSFRWNAQIINRYLELFHLPLREKINKLSKGMKGQLALAIALASEPELLILDEPTSGLDPLKRHEFLNQIVREVSAAGRTIFFSSHNLDEVEQIADWVAIINEGKLVLADQLDNLKLREKSLKVGFDRPIESQELMNIPGVWQVLQDGRRYRLMVRGDVEQVAARVQELGARSVEVVDMNLESIFVAHLQN